MKSRDPAFFRPANCSVQSVMPVAPCEPRPAWTPRCTGAQAEPGPCVARSRPLGGQDRRPEDLSGSPLNGVSSPDLLESGDVEWSAMPNLDQFFTRIYRCPAPLILCPFAIALS